MAVSQAAGFDIHQTLLPTLDIDLDKALSNFHTPISPWESPSEWREGYISQLESIVKAFENASSNERISTSVVSFETASDSDLRVKAVSQYPSIQKFVASTFQDEFCKSYPKVYDAVIFDMIRALDAISLTAQVWELVMSPSNHYHKLMVCASGSANLAQRLLDILQARQGYPMDSSRAVKHLKALIKLSQMTNKFPTCMMLPGVSIGYSPVASGSFGEVYRGTMKADHGRTCIVAVKAIRVYNNSDKTAICAKFSREALTWKQLAHPNLLLLLGVVITTNKLWLVCPWMKNGNLSHYLAAGFRQESCILLILDVASGLKYLHSQNIVHADLKCANVLVTDEGRACLADFGLAVAKSDGSSALGSTAGGSLNWRAPELLPDMCAPDSAGLEGGEPQSASDVYAFAMVCYEVIVLFMYVESKRLTT
ncbi:hypothetical protein HWV62_28011 [Athelia sp. TMB]|nr:hypothetical protein HWV62_28011 [Athelia sp. TMB]